MSLGTSNRDGGKTSESGHLRALAKIVSGDIITGLNAVQRAAGVNMSVDIQVGDAFVRRSDGSYAHPVFNDAVYNQVISAADGSNPRRDIVVIYVDYGQTPSTAVSNNTNGVVKIKVVNGTPAGSPVDPNGAAIQASVGAGNPYSILARVRVPAGQTSISNSLIDDLRTMIYSNATSVNTAAIIDAAVTAAKIAAGAVVADKIADSAIYLGKTNVTSTTSPSTTETTITTTVVTVPSTTRQIKISFDAPQLLTSASASDRWTVRIKEDGVLLQQYYYGTTDKGIPIHHEIVKAAPSAGSHTYVTTYQKDQGSGGGTIYASTAGGNSSIIQQKVELV